MSGSYHSICKAKYNSVSEPCCPQYDCIQSYGFEDQLFAFLTLAASKFSVFCLFIWILMLGAKPFLQKNLNEAVSLAQCSLSSLLKEFFTPVEVEMDCVVLRDCQKFSLCDFSS